MHKKISAGVLLAEGGKYPPPLTAERGRRYKARAREREEGRGVSLFGHTTGALSGHPPPFLYPLSGLSPFLSQNPGLSPIRSSHVLRHRRLLPLPGRPRR